MAEVYASNNATALYQPKLITFGSPGADDDVRKLLSVSTDTLHFQHTGDSVPLVNQKVPGAGDLASRGPIVKIDLPDISDGAFNTGDYTQFFLFPEHHGYADSIQSIISSSLAEEFLLGPAAYRVVIDASEQDGLDLSGTSGRDFIIGYAEDQIFGFDGDDLIDAGLGGDAVYGGNGNDKIAGGAQNDKIFGGSGNDQMEGGAGSDDLNGGDGSDTIYGGTGSDTVHYALNRNQYDITQSGDHFTIKPKAGQPQGEGTDQVYEVENFDFNGDVISAERLVQVTTTPNNPSPPSTSYGDTPGGGSTAVQNQDVPDTTRSMAFVVPGSSSNSGIPFINQIETGGDKDYVRVYLNQGSTYQVYLQGLAHAGYAALADTFFRLRDGRDLSILQPAALPPTNLDSHDQVVGNDARLDFIAPYTGLYFVSIGAGGSNFETLTGGYKLTVTLLGTSPSQPANRNPVVSNESFDAVYGQTVSGNLLSNDTDADHDVLGVDFVNSFRTALGGTLNIVANGAFQYVAPSSGAGSTDSFTYTVRDGAGGSAQGTLFINVLLPPNQMPTFTNGSDVVNIPDGGGPYYALDGHDVLIGSPGLGRVVFGGEGNDIFIAAAAEATFLGVPATTGSWQAQPVATIFTAMGFPLHWAVTIPSTSPT